MSRGPRPRPRPSLASRAESLDRELTAASARAGKGHRCQAVLCEREGTRWVGVWRCDPCPDPAPLQISAEIDPTGRDPHRRHPWRVYGSSRTAREDDDREDGDRDEEGPR